MVIQAKTRFYDRIRQKEDLLDEEKLLKEVLKNV